MIAYLLGKKEKIEIVKFIEELPRHQTSLHKNKNISISLIFRKNNNEKLHSCQITKNVKHFRNRTFHINKNKTTKKNVKLNKITFQIGG